MAGNSENQVTSVVPQRHGWENWSPFPDGTTNGLMPGAGLPRAGAMEAQASANQKVADLESVGTVASTAREVAYRQLGVV
jgi:hypothetical protein